MNHRCSRFISECLVIDLETTKKKSIIAVGAILGKKGFRFSGLKSKREVENALTEIDSYATYQGAKCLMGHNLIDFDFEVLSESYSRLKFLHLPLIDTLYLSPLAFPENPYHRLVKGYKLLRSSLPDPCEDCRLCITLFEDEWECFERLVKNSPGFAEIYRYCLGESCASFFDAIGIRELSGKEAGDIFRKAVRKLSCKTGAGKVIDMILASGNSMPEIAYCLAWLRVSGHNSVIPGWVLHKFNDKISGILDLLRETSCNNENCEYCREHHNPRRQLKKLFGFDDFRTEPETANGGSLQFEIVSAAMSNKPLLGILPTGGGKSLCYQLPALVRNFRRGTLTIVISPLQALMKDQVDNLNRKISHDMAAALYGMLTPPERGDVLTGIKMGDLAILYVSPEQLRNKSFKDAICSREIGCWVFDEAHCLSKWGHAFRPDYLYASRFIAEHSRRQNRKPPSVQCFTATAKHDVVQEIISHFRESLGQEFLLFNGGAERTNLSYEVKTVNSAEKNGLIADILHERLNDEGSAVVYGATRKHVEEIAEYLRMKKFNAEAFHAGLKTPEKRRIQEDFINGAIKVICATNAFGMGIDKDNVRLVIHADIPGSLENYLQEAGRAGRDMNDAECILFYDAQDIEAQFRMQANSSLTYKDANEILKAIKRAAKKGQDEVVLTSGEILRDEKTDTLFSNETRDADTKVKAAVALLERSGFIERNENRTTIFQGRPLLKNMEEAEARIEKLNLPAHRKEQWLAVLREMMNAEQDEGMSADKLAELPVFRNTQKPDDSRPEDTSMGVMRILNDMSESNLIKKDILMTAFIRYKVQKSSKDIFQKVAQLEGAMINMLMEEEPDGEGLLQLSLKRLNQRMSEEMPISTPQLLRGLLRSIAADGRGLAGKEGSIELKYLSRDIYSVRLKRNLAQIRELAAKRRAAAQKILDTLIGKISSNTAPSAEILVEFSEAELIDALDSDMLLSGQVKNKHAAIERALLFLHEQKVIILQQGLAVFRQAMTIKLKENVYGKRFRKENYRPLQEHYNERVFQIHVMDEYAKLWSEKFRKALEMVRDYFTMNKADFVRNYFADRRDVIERATGVDSYQKIVDSLNNPDQIAIVTAKPDSRMLVLAGPGSGKTRVVVHRCAYLLRVKRVKPESILVLCFNRNSAVSLRRRLNELVGNESYGVTVQTYHCLAMRLTGASPTSVSEKNQDEEIDFDGFISEAISLLKGEKDIFGGDADEIRECLLEGYQHILVDEYQDIDERQYDFISAIAGRTSEKENRLSIMAVGDDDQNIYTFRGANVEFIRRFQEDYDAEIYSLLENYRSGKHIIAAANQLIEQNTDRMKTTPIRINKARENESDKSFADDNSSMHEKVKVITVENPLQQAMHIRQAIANLKTKDKNFRYSDCAVLARTRNDLMSVRTVLTENNVPVVWGADTDKYPPLYSIREIRCWLDFLNNNRKDIFTADKLEKAMCLFFPENNSNCWTKLLYNILGEFKEELNAAETTADAAADFFYSALAESKRNFSFGDGVFLNTAHSAKGLEFNHVFITGGGWKNNDNHFEMEEERRLYYVAMTRARHSLCLFNMRGLVNPQVQHIRGDHAQIKETDLSAMPDFEFKNRQYQIWSLKELFIDFAGRKNADNSIHQHLKNLKVNDTLHPAINGKGIILKDTSGCPVAALSATANKQWKDKIDRIESIRVMAVCERSLMEYPEEFSEKCKVEKWEIPICEIAYTEL